MRLTKFKDVSNGRFFEAFLIKVTTDYYWIKFSEDGKLYCYKRENVRILG